VVDLRPRTSGSKVARTVKMSAIDCPEAGTNRVENYQHSGFQDLEAYLLEKLWRKCLPCAGLMRAESCAFRVVGSACAGLDCQRSCMWEYCMCQKIDLISIQEIKRTVKERSEQVFKEQMEWWIARLGLVCCKALAMLVSQIPRISEPNGNTTENVCNFLKLCVEVEEVYMYSILKFESVSICGCASHLEWYCYEVIPYLREYFGSQRHVQFS
jgi:hypothetical protein